MQSVYEELYSVNSEYQQKMDEIVTINSDLENLIQSTEIGTIFLDKNLNIRKFTPAVKKIFKIIESDIGRPISHFNISLGEHNDMSFLETLKEVLDTGKFYEKEILHEEKTWYLKRLNPFISTNNKIEGVVISFVNITPLKRLEKEMDNKNVFLQKIIDIMPNILYIFNHETQSNEYVNKDLYKHLGYTPVEIQTLGDKMLETIMHP